MNIIKKLIKYYSRPIFKKYVAIGAFVAITGIVFTSSLNFIGTVIFGYDVRIVSAIVYCIVFTYGFLTKFGLYDKYGMLKNEK